MQNVKHSRFSLILLAIIGAGVVVLIVGLLILQHENSQTKLTKVKVEALIAKYNEREENAKNIDKLEKKLADIDARLSQLDKNLIAYEYIPTYLQEIQNTAGRTASSLKNIQPGPRKNLDLTDSPFAAEKKPESKAGEKKADAAAAQTAEEKAEEKEGSAAAKTKKKETSPYQIMSINLNVHGSYSSMLRLLNQFRLFRKMIYVKSINLSVQRGTETRERTLQGRLETYAIITPDQYKSENSQSGKQQNAQPKKIAEGGKP